MVEMPKTADVAQLDHPSPATTNRPKAIFAVGRGRCGKTVAYRWMIDRALKQGRELIIADGDRTNQTLGAFFPNVESPPSAADDTMRPWLDGLIERAINQRKSLLLDLGGGDLLLKQTALELDLPGELAQHGVTPVVLHFIGADTDDLAYLRVTERKGLFAPEHTAVIFNVGVVPAGVSPEAALEKHTRDPALMGALERGGSHLIVMPRLVCMTVVDDARLRFSEAVYPKIGLMNGSRVRLWLRDMETAFDPIASWLP
jgi:hypothetical protein